MLIYCLSPEKLLFCVIGMKSGGGYFGLFKLDMRTSLDPVHCMSNALCHVIMSCQNVSLLFSGCLVVCFQSNIVTFDN